MTLEPSDGPTRPHPTFGGFRLDPDRHVLWRGDELVELQRLPTRVLAHLVDQPGEVVLRSELRDRFWGGVRLGFDDRLNTCIAAIRTALGDSATDPRFVATIRGRGYRFVAEVQRDGRGERALVRTGLRGRTRAGLVAASLALLLTSPHFPSAPEPPTPSDPAARDYYLRALGVARSGENVDLETALELLDRSRALAPDFAPAHAGFAAVGSMLAFFRSEPLLRRQAMDAARRLDALSPETSSAALAHGLVALYGQRDFEAAVRHLRSARSTMGDDAVLLMALADAHRRRGEWPESDRLYRRVLADDPARADVLGDLALNRDRRRDWRQAERLWLEALTLEPRRTELLVGRALTRLKSGAGADEVAELLERAPALGAIPAAYVVHFSPELARIVGPRLAWRTAKLERIDERGRGFFLTARAWLLDRTPAGADAWEEAARWLEPRTGSEDDWRGIPHRQGFYAVALAKAGHRERAKTQVDEILRRFPADRDGVTSPYLRARAAEALVALGEHDAALRLLEELLSRPSNLAPALLAIDPAWDALRGDPRFERLGRPR